MSSPETGAKTLNMRVPEVDRRESRNVSVEAGNPGSVRFQGVLAETRSIRGT